jgi:periplasmic protein TonB
LSQDDRATGTGIPGGIDLSFGQGSGLLGDVARLPPPPAAPIRRTEEKTPAPAKPIHVSTGVQAAKLITQVNPAYPALAKQARVSGTVRLTAIIGRDGAIRNLQVMGGHPLLTPAALEAVKQWRYQPTLLNDEPVEVITQIDVNFTLSR